MTSEQLEQCSRLNHELRVIEAKLQRINILASKVATEEIDTCCRFELKSPETRILGEKSIGEIIAEMDGDSLHTHCNSEEILEIFGILVRRLKEKEKTLTQRLKEMGVTR